MKDEKIANLENQPKPPIAEKPKKAAKKTAKPKKNNKEANKQPKKEVNSVPLPVLVEFTYTASVLLLIVLALTIFVLSALSGASLFTLVLRTSVTIFVMGGLLTFISSQVSSGLLFSSRIEQEEYEKKQEEELEKTDSIEDLSKTEAD